MNTMILASGVSIAINLLFVILVAVCLLLCLVVLMQRPKQEGLGAAFGGGMTDQAFGARTTDVLQKGTVYLGTAFFLITLTLSILVSVQNAQGNTAAEVAKDTEEQLADASVADEVAEALAAEVEEAAAVVTEEVASEEAPVVETPVIETPEVAAPVVETPEVETPAVEVPAVETPAVEVPAIETPAVEVPATQ